MSLISPKIVSQANSIAQTLGLNQWDLKDAKWNGYTFATANNNILAKLGSTSGSGGIIGLGGSAVSEGTNIYNATKSAFGLGDEKNIPSGANMQLMNSVDVFKRKLAINKLPNGKDNIRGLGYYGQEVVLLGIDWGVNYAKGMQGNLRNMFLSDQTISPTDPNYHVLEHPFWGRIEGVWLESMRIIHDSKKWRACVYELRFLTERPIGLNTVNRSSLQILNDAVSALFTTYSSLNNLWSSFEMVVNTNTSVKAQQNNNKVKTQVATIQTNVLASASLTVTGAQILSNNLAPANFNNIQLNGFQASITNISTLSYFNGHTSAQDVDNMIDYLTNNINNTIQVILDTGSNYYYDTINLLQALIAQISFIALNLLTAYYGQVKEYQVPYDTSLFIICQLNSLDYETNYDKIVQLNQSNLTWLNKVSKGDVLTLPIGV